jgi:hypothetical protein
MVAVFVVVGLVINLIISTQVAKLGSEKKIGYNSAFWLSFFFSPIIGLLMVIASVPKTEEEKENEEKTIKEDKTPLIFMSVFILVIAFVVYQIFKN